MTKLKLDKLLQLWKNELIREDIQDVDNVLAWAILGPQAYTKSDSASLLKRKIKTALSFESRLVELCKAFDFNVGDPKYISIPTPPGKTPIADTFVSQRLESGLLENKVGGALVTAIDENRRYVEKLRNILEKRKKTGPPRTPAFFAWHLIVAIDLFKSSPSHLGKIRQFFESGGEFEKWLGSITDTGLADEKGKKQIEKLFISKKSKLDMDDWAPSRRQAMVNSLLEDKTKKKTMKERGADPEIREINLEARKRLMKFIEKI